MEAFSNPIVRGDLRTIVRISLPFILFLFCESLVVFWERVFLSYEGPEAVASALNGTYLAVVFQAPCMGIASMAQVFVGLYQGKDELKRIGPCIWQLIWFSLLSLIVTLPLSFWSSSVYFQGTVIQQLGSSYFNILAWGNFLFPLNIALTSFYLGRGKTMLVTLLLLASYACNVVLCWGLIFGVEGFIPPLGIRGAALAKCLSMGLFCLVFLSLFLSEKNRKLYETDSWHLSLTALWSYIRPGMIRAFMFLWGKVVWIMISYMMIKKGGLYSDALTIGGTMLAFLVFIPMGVYRSLLTITSNLLGSKNYGEIWRLCRSLMMYGCIIGLIVAIPLIFYPQTFAYFFDASLKDQFESVFKIINHWVWLFVVAITIQMGLCGMIVALQDWKAQFYCCLLSVLTSLLPVYLTLQFWGWEPNKLWLIMAMENVILAIFFFYRLYQRRWGETQPILI